MTTADRATTGTSWLIGFGLLVLILTVEVLPARQVAVPAGKPFARPQTAIEPSRRGHAGDDAKIVLARPLFSIHRRPTQGGLRPNSSQSMNLPRLSGIIIAASYRRAIFDGNGKELAGGIGDHIGPYSILAIAPRQVTVGGPYGVQALTLSFGAYQPPPPAGPSILDRLNSQRFRPPPMPSSAAIQQLLLRQLPRTSP